MTERRLIHVAAGAIADAAGRVLVARRPDEVHQGGLWEFPGGKLHGGETPRQGLDRELAEELGIRVTAARPLIQVRHDYGDRHVLLDVHRVTGYEGIPEGREGQPLEWIAPEAMDPARFPAADRPIITALRLPTRYLITGPDAHDVDGFLARLQQALAQGLALVQLRAHELDDGAYLSLAEAAQALCRRFRARLLLNRAPDVAARVDSDGVHVPARMLAGLRARPLPPNRLVGASCHDAGELARAAALGLDYALLSPVAATASHPGSRPLGWARFAELVAPATLPVYALGGLGPADLSLAFAHGAQGVAGISGFWPRVTSR
jgi:8-oxo-dGTP diphosphatase